MAQAVRKAFAADADSYDRARRKLVPCFDDFFRTARELLPVCSEIQLRRRPGSERARCSVFASGMSRGLQMDRQERRRAELA
jgi:hypothetical protein